MMTRARLAATIAVTILLPLPSSAQEGLAGPYLAGRAASASYDYRAAAQYYTQALLSDPANPGFLESDALAFIAMGDFEKAGAIVAQLDTVRPPSQIAELFRFATLAKNERWKDIQADFDKGRTAAPLVDGLIRAWALLGDGNMTAATEGFDALAAESGAKPFALYHKALALASVGDFEGADKIFSGEAAGPLALTRRGVIAHAQVLSQLERAPDAVELIDKALGTNLDPATAALRADLAAGKPLAFTAVTSARDGVAEVLYGVGAALATDVPDAYTLAYSQLATYVRPDLVEPMLLSAGLLEQQGQYDLASAAYSNIPADAPAYVSAELGRTQVLIKAGKVDAAIEALQQLAKARPELPAIWSTLGDTLRRQERFKEAADAYDKAISTFAADQPNQWIVYYSRGITSERQKLWAPAEADFRKALALSPDQPQVLNYLGYGLLERGEKLDEAMQMIQRAVALRPDDGYIADSLGWALFRTGRFDEAAVQMEKAIALLPSDPVVNDHVGDVFWAVGRRLEAEFQWRRALSYDPKTEPDPARVRRKLDIGLDAVLKEEGAPPLAVSANGN